MRVCEQASVCTGVCRLVLAPEACLVRSRQTPFTSSCSGRKRQMCCVIRNKGRRTAERLTDATPDSNGKMEAICDYALHVFFPKAQAALRSSYGCKSMQGRGVCGPITSLRTLLASEARASRRSRKSCLRREDYVSNQRLTSTISCV